MYGSSKHRRMVHTSELRCSNMHWYDYTLPSFWKVFFRIQIVNGIRMKSIFKISFQQKMVFQCSLNFLEKYSSAHGFTFSKWKKIKFNIQFDASYFDHINMTENGLEYDQKNSRRQTWTLELDRKITPTNLNRRTWPKNGWIWPKIDLKNPLRRRTWMS